MIRLTQNKFFLIYYLEVKAKNIPIFVCTINQNSRLRTYTILLKLYKNIIFLPILWSIFFPA